NASADTVFDIQVKYDNTAQPLQIAALDGVPTGSQDGTRQGKLVTAKDIMLGPGNRAEFIVTMNSARLPGPSIMSFAVTSLPWRVPSCEPVGTPSSAAICSGCAVLSYLTWMSKTVSADA